MAINWVFVAVYILKLNNWFSRLFLLAALLSALTSVIVIPVVEYIGDPDLSIGNRI